MFDALRRSDLAFVGSARREQRGVRRRRRTAGSPARSAPLLLSTGPGRAHLARRAPGGGRRLGVPCSRSPARSRGAASAAAATAICTNSPTSRQRAQRHEVGPHGPHAAADPRPRSPRPGSPPRRPRTARSGWRSRRTCCSADDTSRRSRSVARDRPSGRRAPNSSTRPPHCWPRAERPAIIAGGGVAARDALGQARRARGAARRAGRHDLRRQGRVPLGRTRSPLQSWIEDRHTTDFLEDADVLLVVGSGLGEVSTNYHTFAPRGRVIQIEAEPGKLESNHPAPRHPRRRRARAAGARRSYGAGRATDRDGAASACRAGPAPAGRGPARRPGPRPGAGADGRPARGPARRRRPPSGT